MYNMLCKCLICYTNVWVHCLHASPLGALEKTNCSLFPKSRLSRFLDEIISQVPTRRTTTFVWKFTISAMFTHLYNLYLLYRLFLVYRDDLFQGMIIIVFCIHCILRDDKIDTRILSQNFFVAKGYNIFHVRHIYCSNGNTHSRGQRKHIL